VGAPLGFPLGHRVLFMFSVVTGKLGSGKSLFTASLIEDAARRGKRIVTNFDLNFDKYTFSYPLDCTVIPTRPTSDILQELGRGSDREDQPGLMVIDEGALILNSRTWNDKDREKVISWFAMSRKLNWDVYVIIQHVSALDKQIREMFCEIFITCMRLDRLKIPLLGASLPRIHIAVGKYGSQPGAPVTQRWIYRGNKQLYSLYNTSFIFDPEKKEVVKKLTAKTKRGIMYYLNQPLDTQLAKIKKVSFYDICYFPLFVTGSLFVSFFSFFDGMVTRSKS
jgi:zona occludens toxin (predicted ATPase)